MPDRTSKKRPRDINQLAAAIVDDATREDAPAQLESEAVPDQPEKNLHAQALGRLGGLKGGKARAEKLTPEERSRIAREAARKRWKTAGVGPKSDTGSEE